MIYERVYILHCVITIHMDVCIYVYEGRSAVSIATRGRTMILLAVNISVSRQHRRCRGLFLFYCRIVVLGQNNAYLLNMSDLLVISINLDL